MAEERLGRPDVLAGVRAAGRPITAERSAVASATEAAVAAPARDVRRIGRVERVVALVVLAAMLLGGAWFGWRAWRGVPVSLEVDGEPIVNAEQVLADADAEFRDLARIDGAPLADGAGCWFAPAPEDAQGAADRPRVACGPVRFGVSGDGEDWVTGAVSYVPSSGAEGVNGRFTKLTGPERLRPHLLRRPDGDEPPDGAPRVGDAGLRATDGRILSGLDQALSATDAAFTAAATEAGAATGEDTRCYLGVSAVASPAGTRSSVSDGKYWCGPLLLSDSDEAKPWFSFNLSLSPGETFVEALPGRPYVPTPRRTVGLPADLELRRPDGARPPAGVGGLEPPDAGPVDAGTVEVLETLPSGGPAPRLTAPADGRLATPQLTLTLTGLGRAAKVGAGAEAIVADDGEGLVVARFEAARAEGSFGNGTATLVVDGERTAIRGWSSVRDSGVLVAAVPDDADDVRLELLSLDRAQSVSLLTGERGPEVSPVPYRRTTEVSPDAAIRVDVALPAGEPVRLTGTVARIRWAAWDRDGWAPEGRAFVEAVIDDWKLERPCCEVRDVEVTTTWRLLLPNGKALTETDPSRTAALTPEPRFDVPESVTRARLRLQVQVAYTVDGRAGTAESRPVDVPFAVQP